jgi:hypothetical protein
MAMAAFSPPRSEYHAFTRLGEPVCDHFNRLDVAGRSSRARRARSLRAAPAAPDDNGILVAAASVAAQFAAAWR